MKNVHLICVALLCAANAMADAPNDGPQATPPAINAAPSEDDMDIAEEEATVLLDDKFITGDIDEAEGEGALEAHGGGNKLVPLEPGGGEGLLKPSGIIADSYVIPGADNPLVEKYRAYYLTPVHIKWLCDVLESGEQYRLYVRARLKEKGMPSYLEYLPVVESNYKTNARSRTGALGLWQFMSNSTKGFLRRDDFVDERLDPWRSTDAALSKLMANYNQFGDWPLALAAYNCGAGAMQGILRRNPGKDFWALAEAGALRKETAQYVPRLLAIADICENAALYGADIPTGRDADGKDINPRAGAFDYADTKGAVSLKRLAEDLKIDEDMLLSMNSALFREITPHTPYTVRVPEGMGEAAEYALERIEPYHFQTRYTVVAGDSLWKISRAFHVTLASLCEVNGINEKTTLKIGKNLYIPN